MKKASNLIKLELSSYKSSRLEQKIRFLLKKKRP